MSCYAPPLRKGNCAVGAEPAQYVTGILDLKVEGEFSQSALRLTRLHVEK